jgi:ATP-dependent DNA helicase RecG
MDPFDVVLEKLAELVVTQRFVEMETDLIEIKPVPAHKNERKAIHESVNAFLNTRGGTIILGIKEEQNPRRYVVSDWKEHAENNLKEFANQLTDRAGNPVNLTSSFPRKEIRDMPRGLGRVCIVYVDPLPADQRYVFLDGKAYTRHLTGDVKLTLAQIESQEDFREQAKYAKELQPNAGLTLAGLDLLKAQRVHLSA